MKRKTFENINKIKERPVTTKPMNATRYFTVFINQSVYLKELLVF